MKYFHTVLTMSLALFLFSACDNSSESKSSDKHVMFFSSNWGERSIRITDDLLSYDDGEAALPRIIAGTSTTINSPTLDSLAVDKERGLVYLTDRGSGYIIVYENVDTIEGNIAPDRIISVSGEYALEGIAVDTARDRLYVSGTSDSIWIFNNASTIQGAITPDAVLDYNVMSIFIDEENDRLYAGTAYSEGNSIYVFDTASALQTDDTPDRTITFSGDFDPTGIWVDSQKDRLYTCDNGPSAGGNYLFVYENAGTMNGSYTPDTDSVARINAESISLAVDQLDNLYAWPDEATSVRIYYNASSLSGDIAGPDKTVPGVVDRGYGMGSLVY